MDDCGDFLCGNGSRAGDGLCRDERGGGDQIFHISVFLAIFHVLNCVFLIFVIFSFLAIFQVLQCAFLIFQVFQ